MNKPRVIVRKKIDWERRKYFLMNKKEVYGGLLSLITKVAGIDNAKKFDTLFRDHKKLNLKNPQTLSEKCLT